jgi:hypothetical protein
VTEFFRVEGLVVTLDDLAQSVQHEGHKIRLRGSSVPRAQQTAERLRRCATVQLMRVGPSESACRSRFQTTFGGFVQKARS